MTKFLVSLAITFFSFSTQAKIIELTGSGTIAVGDYHIWDPNMTGLPAFPQLDFTFTTSFDLTEYTSFNTKSAIQDSTHFQFSSQKTKATAYINGNPVIIKAAHTFTNEAPIPNTGLGIAGSVFSLNLVIFPTETERTLVSPDYYVSYFQIFGGIGGLFDDFLELDSPDRIAEALVDDITQFVTRTGSVGLGLTSDTGDSGAVATGFTKTVNQINHVISNSLQISARFVSTSVPEPNTLVILIFSALTLVKLRRLN